MSTYPSYFATVHRPGPKPPPTPGHRSDSYAQWNKQITQIPHNITYLQYDPNLVPSTQPDLCEQTSPSNRQQHVGIRPAPPSPGCWSQPLQPLRCIHHQPVWPEAAVLHHQDRGPRVFQFKIHLTRRSRCRYVCVFKFFSIWTVTIWSSP